MKKKPKSKIQKFADSLKKNLPKSELWFLEEYKNSGFPRYNEDSGQRSIRFGHSNRVFCNKYIPDFVNHKLKYIIEVDGSIHQLEHVKNKDKIKTEYYEKRHYTVIRIEAYNYKSLYFGLLRIAKKYKNYCYYCRDEQWRVYDYFIQEVYKKYPEFNSNQKSDTYTKPNPVQQKTILIKKQD